MAEVSSDVPHVDYPHEPGRLHDCYACESGPCVCTVESAPCVSDECTQTCDARGGE